MSVRPLKKTYDPKNPYVVERHDQEDGSITYEIWDYRPDSYRRLCSVNENYDSDRWDEEDGRPKHNAKSDADMIVRGLNFIAWVERVATEVVNKAVEKLRDS